MTGERRDVACRVGVGVGIVRIVLIVLIGGVKNLRRHPAAWATEACDGEVCTRNDQRQALVHYLGATIVSDQNIGLQVMYQLLHKFGLIDVGCLRHVYPHGRFPESASS